MKLITGVISPGGKRDRANVNTVFDNIATVSAAVDAYNWAEEGLDWRPFEDHLAWERLSLITEPTRSLLAPTGGFATYAPNGTSFRTAAGLVTLGAGEAIRITTFAVFRTTLAGGFGIDRNTNLLMKHSFHIIPATFDVNASLRGWFNGAPAGTTGLHGSMMLESYIYSTGVPLIIDWVETRYDLAGGTGIVHPQSGIQIVEKLPRVAVVEV